MKICYFGIYDPQFSRNNVYMRGLKQIGAEIVECRDSSPGLAKFWRLWKKHRSLRNNYDALIVGYPGHIVAPWARIISSKPVIADLLGSLADAEKYSHDTDWFHLLKLRLIDWLAVRFADVIFLESEAQKKYFEEHFGKSKKYAVVYTGVDEEVFGSPDTGTANDGVIGDGVFKVFFRGKLTPECGIRHILTAAELLKGEPKISFTIIGRGYLLELTERIIKERELHNVDLISRYLSNDEMRKAIAEASLYLGQFENNPRLERTIPHKAFEAFAAGIPYISADAPAIAELVEDGKTGFLVPAADPGALADKIRLLARDPKLLESVLRSARDMYEKRLSTRVVGCRILSIISSGGGKNDDSSQAERFPRG